MARAPAWMAEEILSASQAIDQDRAAVWMSENYGVSGDAIHL